MESLDFHTHQAITRQLFSKPGVPSEKAKGRAGTASPHPAVSVENTWGLWIPSSLANIKESLALSSKVVTDNV